MPALATIDVDAAQLSGSLVDEREHGVAVGDVGRDGESPAARRGDLLGDRFGAGLVDVADRDGVPVAGQPERDAAPDPPPGPRDHDVAHTRSFGVTRILTFSSLFSISSVKPLLTRSSSAIRPVMNWVASTFLSCSRPIVAGWSPQ